MKTPEHYKAPLRSRRAILDFLLNRINRRFYDRRGFLFCFNVKCYSADLSFENLLSVAKEQDIEHLNDVMFMHEARERFEKHENELFNWGVEDARRTFTGREADHYSKPDDDGYNTLWDGTAVDVEFAFLGRSGGWLCLTHFEGTPLADEGDINSLDYRTLRLLYRYIVMLKADLERSRASRRVEEAAAWAFFANVCGDVVTSTEAAKAV